MIYTKDIRWDTKYDVVVIGFGGAGATAARFAADNKAKVLLIDSAPEGSEGGNTRYCAGGFAVGKTTFEGLKNYYLQSYGPFYKDEKALDTFLKGVMNLPKYTKKYFGLKASDPFAVNQSNGLALSKESITQAEYPEYKDNNSMKIYSVTTLYDGSFWKLLHEQVYNRLNLINIWYQSPAEHLIQDMTTKTVVGVQIKRKNRLVNVLAKKGVILALGGFENNRIMVQDFLGQGALAPIGTLYNKGKGIDLAVEVGARLWHMSNYDSHGISLNEGKEREQFPYMINWPTLFNGSIFIAGDDGTRYFREDEKDRHGYKYNHGDFRVIPSQNHAHIIFDQNKYEQLLVDKSANAGQIKELLTYAVKASTIEELAKKIKAPKLPEEIQNFNFFVEQGKDYELNRSIKTMQKLSNSGSYYAIPIRANILHTHGGARRNEKAEVIDINGRVIPHLFEAGELGDLFATHYIGASSVADLLISGKISGINAAKEKEIPEEIDFDVITSASEGPKDLKTDAVKQKSDFPVKKNQYIGISEKGMGNLPIAVRLTVNDDKRINNVEILQEEETPTIGEKAFDKLKKEVLDSNSANIDVVSGASATSRAFKEAVSNAIKEMKK